MRVAPSPAVALALVSLAACSARPTPPPARVIPKKASAALWEAYARAPATHPNIPDDSYAGYHANERPLPSPAVVATVRREPAGADDTPAIQAAIDEASQRGGGAVWVPEGTYRLAGMLRITSSRLVLRGAGPARTVLVFTKPLDEVLGPRGYQGASEYSWFGGLVWVGPTRAGDGATRALDDAGGWRAGGNATLIAAPAQRGDDTITVADASAIAPGQLVLLEWQNRPDRALLAQMSGLASFAWEGAHTVADEDPIRWPVTVKTVEGRRVTLSQPLRLDVRGPSRVAVAAAAPVLEEVGVEHLALRMESGPPNEHGQDRGYNGIFFSHVYNGWIDDVVVRDADNGILTQSVKNATIQRFVIEGDRPQHHATASKYTHDTRFSDFRVASRPFHGINVSLSSGDVWQRGVMDHGTFDGHRAMSFDLLRTNLLIHNDGQVGGDVGTPHNGARVVHWNLVVSGSGRFVAQPALLPFGALVGVRGVPTDARGDPDGLMPADNGCAVGDEGEVPEPPDLFEAQLALRRGRGR